MKHRKDESDFMDEVFHPEQPICQIISTKATKPQCCFTKYRPKHGFCLDYNISQTDTKFDAGDTKIHVQETVAHYVPNPEPPKPKKRKIRYFSGIPPKWKFLEDVWVEKQKRLQEEFHEEFKERVRERKKKERFAGLSQHNNLLALVGPEWFQELSPKQLTTIDSLKNCILKDLAEGTFINTKENIAELGLVLRPNPAHIKKALKNCCKCPVEFLLILYQLINPQRKKYSINDRLLLSGVVHLTMLDTLKELHIRIPSPPPPPKIKQEVPKKKKKVKYESPYLKPFSYERPPPKFSGIYRNKHVQRPQSRYFCYLKELKQMKEQIETEVKHILDVHNVGVHVAKHVIPQAVIDEIEEEYIVAQTTYENLVDFKPVPILLKPSIYIPCDNFRNKVKGEEVVKKDSPCCILNRETCDAETEIGEEIEVEAGNVEECCDDNVEIEFCSTNSTAVENLSQVQNIRNDEFASTRTQCGTILYTENVTDNEEFNKICDDEPSATEEVCIECAPAEKQTCKHQKDLEIYDKMYPLIRPTTKERQPCICKKKYREEIEKEFCPCDQCVEERKEKNITTVIAGLTDVDQSTIPIIDRIQWHKPCDCLKKYEKMIEEFENARDKARKVMCACTKKVREMLETPHCQCEKCEEDRRSKAAKFIIAGTKDDEEMNRIMDGISLGRPCKCVKDYERKVEEYNYFQQRKNIVAELKSLEEKYVIGGVATGPDGLTYIISGLRPPIDCACAKKAREEAERKHMEAIMPKVPKGRIQYGIGGVRETKDGNVYILDNALAIDDCACMDVYNNFEGQHKTCMQLYHEYLGKMKEEYNEFMSEMLVPEDMASSQVKSDQDIVEERTELEQEENTQKEESKVSVKDGGYCHEVIKKEDDRAYCHELVKKEDGGCTCQEVKICCLMPKDECAECVCGVQSSECIDCTCASIEEIEEEIELKRFFLYDRISCDPKWQRMVVKKALDSMAEDGFPLAKLPEAYKLPHFKLWMQMRCKKFWTLEDRFKYVLYSRGRIKWMHTDHCDAWKVRLHKLGISKSQAKLIDWSQAGHCRKLVNTTLDGFYREVNQNQIHFGREFFPTTYTYEFPFESWRDCYFAYTPSKEEEVTPRFAWQTYEYKNYAKMKRHCR